MGMTISEKILAKAAGRDRVSAGEIHTLDIDRLMSNDCTSHLTIDMFNTILKKPRIADKDKLVFIIRPQCTGRTIPKQLRSQKDENFARR